MLGPASSRLQSAGKHVSVWLPKQNNWPATTRGASSWSSSPNTNTWSKWPNICWSTWSKWPAGGAPGASGQTCQTFGQPKGQAASQTLGENDQTPGRGCNTVRQTEKKVYTTVQGKCYHMDPECQRIRNRHAVVEKAPCSVCLCANMQCLPNFELDAKLPKSDKGWRKLMSDKLLWNKDAA